MAKVYKIRDKTTGLFSKGGECFVTFDIQFTKNGKVWTSISNLSQHLTASCKSGITKINGKNVRFDLSQLDPNHPYHNCEIMEADINFQPVKSVTDFIDKKVNSGCKAEDAIK